MSGVTKALGKVFRKVVPGLKKILPAGLALGALVFTAGAALGSLPTWGSAISQTAAKLGLGEGLTNILTGAVTQAGYGAALGAAGAAITGGKVDKGALLGALTGAITGGVSGAAGWETDPLKGLNDDPMKATADTVRTPANSGVVEQSSNYLDPGDGVPGVDNDMNVGGGAAGPRRGLLVDDLTSDVPGSTRVTSTGATTEPKGWLERHQTLVGSGIAGAGRAAATYLAGGAEASAAEKAREQRAANYRSGTRGLMVDQPADQPVDPTNARAPVPTPTGPAPRTPQTVGGYRYDKNRGGVDWVNEGAA